MNLTADQRTMIEGELARRREANPLMSLQTPRIYGIWDGTSWRQKPDESIHHSAHPQVMRATIRVNEETWPEVWSGCEVREIGCDGLPFPWQTEEEKDAAFTETLKDIGGWR